MAQTPPDWLAESADAVVAHAAARKPDDATLVCASGISPSGEIHLGNLREILTTHFVAEELRARGRPVDHLHSWDDFDRLRKVPEGFEHMAEFIGRPLADVPDPHGEHDSWASRFIHQFESAMAEIGVTPRWIRQSTMYRQGTYTAAIIAAMNLRAELFEVLARFMTKQTPEALAEMRETWWPYRIYSPHTGTDDTQILAWHPDSATIRYRCNGTGKVEETCLHEETLGKLLWKVDWPMRWAHERVDFEPGGEDHATPGSSYTVGVDVVPHFGWVAPSFIAYAFVGMAGRTKMSSSKGTGATPEFALRFIEPALLRWLYLRRPPKKKFSIDFGVEIWRQYDEWDAADRKVAKGRATPLEEKTRRLALEPSTGPLPTPRIRLPFRTLTAAAETTDLHRAQVLRIAALNVDDPPEDLEAALQPRLDCALGWVDNVLPDDERLTLREAHDPEVWAALDSSSQEAVRRLLAELDTHWTLSKLTDLVYGIPKDMAGLPRDVKPTPELKQSQRAFFVALYTLLLGTDTGPRLPTLLLSLGQERVRRVLTPE